MYLSVTLHLLVLAMTAFGSMASVNYPRVQFTTGSPWPLPASMNTTTDSQVVDAMLFRFKATAQTCDVLEAAFVRYFAIIFYGQPFSKKYKMGKHESQQLLFKPGLSNGGLTSLEVAVWQKCEKLPSLEMDESCELFVIAIAVLIATAVAQ